MEDTWTVYDMENHETCKKMLMYYSAKALNFEAENKQLKMNNKMLLEMAAQYHFVNDDLREEIKKLKSNTALVRFN